MLIDDYARSVYFLDSLLLMNFFSSLLFFAGEELIRSTTIATLTYTIFNVYGSNISNRKEKLEAGLMSPICDNLAHAQVCRIGWQFLTRHHPTRT